MTDKIRKKGKLQKQKKLIFYLFNLIHFKSLLFECLGDALLTIIWIRWSDSIIGRGTIQCLLKRWKKVEVMLQLPATMDWFTWLADMRLEGVWTASKCLRLKSNFSTNFRVILFCFTLTFVIYLHYNFELNVKRKFFFNQGEFIQLTSIQSSKIFGFFRKT